MMALRSAELGTEKLMSLLGTSFSGSVSHLSNVSLVHVILDFCNAGEYWNDATEPAARPYTPARPDLPYRDPGVAAPAALLERLLAGGLRTGYAEIQEKS